MAQHDDTLMKLGTVRAKDEGRDAIHIAVLTMQAQAAFHVYGKLWVDKEGVVNVNESPLNVGIVDPFLPPGTKVSRGDWFYVYLNPGSISGLVHVWTHPDFPEPADYPEPSVLGAGVMLPPLGGLTAKEDLLIKAKERVEAFCAGADMSLDYHGFIQLFELGHCENFSWEGDGSIYSGDEEISSEVPLAVLRDVELIIGRDLAVTEDIYFRCAC